jgi:hypothetical protein
LKHLYRRARSSAAPDPPPFAKQQERIPIFGDFGLAAQLGSADYARPRKFRERLERWLELVRTLWPSCPARMANDGESMIVQPAMALTAKGA